MATPVDDLLRQVRDQFIETQGPPPARVIQRVLARRFRSPPPVDDLLHQIRDHFDKAQDAINSLVRVQIGQGLPRIDVIWSAQAIALRVQ